MMYRDRELIQNDLMVLIISEKSHRIKNISRHAFVPKMVILESVVVPESRHYSCLVSQVTI